MQSAFGLCGVLPWACKDENTRRIDPEVSDLMGDVAKGIKSFKKGLSEEPAEAAADVKTIGEEAAQPAKQATEKAKS